MSSNQKEYKRLDLSKINFKNTIISTEEALKDIVPIAWSDDVLNGKYRNQSIIHMPERK